MTITAPVISSIYLILPAYLANTGPVIAEKLHLPLGIPINEKLFGSHKTWRGFYAGYLMALGGLWLQFFLQSQAASDTTQFAAFLQSYTLLDYQSISLFLYAFLFGIGAIFGDLIKSFFKRRLGHTPGSPWIPFDQLDFVIGTLIFLSPFYIPPLPNILTILIITPILHLLANILAYKIGIKKVWW